MKNYSHYNLNTRKSLFDPKVYKARHYMATIALPEVFDYKDIFDKYFPVFDQGSEGSCVACAGTAMRQEQEYKDVNLLAKLSEQFIYNNRTDLTQEGMDMQNLMDILRKVGICLSALCIYGSTPPPAPSAYKDALSRLTVGYAKVETLDELKQALFQNGPCVMAVPVYNYSTRMWYQNSGDTYLGGHGLAIIGWTKVGFIIRNSWGPDWGDKGYCVLPYEDFPLIWEVWTTIDSVTPKPEPTPTPTPIPVPNKSKLVKIILWIVGAVVALVSSIFTFKK